MWGIFCACDKNFEILFLWYILGLIGLQGLVLARGTSPLILGKILNAFFEATNIFDVWLWYQSFSK